MTQPVIKMIVAYANNRIIGSNNQIPWKLSNDLKRFKELTTNNVVVMGRKTFESIGSKPLPDRTNIVLTRNKELTHPDIFTFQDIPTLMNFINTYMNDKIIYIIGGAEIYNQFLSLCDEILATEVHSEVTGDTFFPTLSDRVWTQSDIIKMEENGILYDFVTYRRF